MVVSVDGGGKDAPVSTVIAAAYETEAQRKEAAAMSDHDRQVRVETMLVDYPLFEKGVEAMRAHHMPVASGRHLRGQICGIIGEPRTGKSTAIRHYVDLCGDVADPDVKDVRKIIYVDCHENWSASDLAHALYKAIGFTSVPRLRIELLFDQVCEEIARVGVEMLVIDDAQWAVASREKVMLKHAFGLIVGLAERKICNVVLSGTMPILRAIEANPHAKGRGQFPKRELHPYCYGDPKDRESFQFLLQAIDDRLPFAEISGLARKSWQPHLFKISGGSMGNLMDYVRAAALKAIEAKTECIHLEHITDAVEERYEAEGGYVPFGTTIDLAAVARREADRHRLEAQEIHLQPSRPAKGRGTGR